MRRFWLRFGVGAVGSSAVLALLGAGLHRAYGPGDLAERGERLYRRWRPFFDPPGEVTAVQIWRFIGGGLLDTLEVAGISMVLSLIIGIVLALLRLGRNRALSLPGGPLARLAAAAPSGVLVQSIRSAPLFMLILYAFIAAPRFGLQLSAYQAGVFALTLYTSCVVAEIVRAGILSLDRGQFEAADALGLGYLKKLRFVVLPQALRRMIPAIVSQLVTLMKDTSLLSFITVIELSRRLYILQQQYLNPIESFAVAGLIYFIINFALSTLARRIEVRPARVGTAAPPVVQGIGTEDQTLLATQRAR